jgi:hypothetical protein
MLLNSRLREMHTYHTYLEIVGKSWMDPKRQNAPLDASTVTILGDEEDDASRRSHFPIVGPHSLIEPWVHSGTAL